MTSVLDVFKSQRNRAEYAINVCKKSGNVVAIRLLYVAEVDSAQNAVTLRDLRRPSFTEVLALDREEARVYDGPPEPSVVILRAKESLIFCSVMNIPDGL